MENALVLNCRMVLRFILTLVHGSSIHVIFVYRRKIVEIVGEAFFSVKSDPARPFIVNAEKLNVQVLGTEFNVAAYPEDIQTEVVLLEGKVAMYPDSKSLNGQPYLRV